MTLAQIAKLRLDAENILTWEKPTGDVGDILMFAHLQRFAKAVLELSTPKEAQPRKTKQQIADEAYLRASGGLPGQTSFVDPDPDLADAAPPIGLVPLACPNCSRGMTLAHGWAYSREAPWTIQCPNCGKRYAVSEEDHHEYRRCVQEHYAAMRVAPLPKKKHRRSRGAR